MVVAAADGNWWRGPIRCSVLAGEHGMAGKLWGRAALGQRCGGDGGARGGLISLKSSDPSPLGMRKGASSPQVGQSPWACSSFVAHPLISFTVS